MKNSSSQNISNIFERILRKSNLNVLNFVMKNLQNLLFSLDQMLKEFSPLRGFSIKTFGIDCTDPYGI